MNFLWCQSSSQRRAGAQLLILLQPDFRYPNLRPDTNTRGASRGPEAEGRGGWFRVQGTFPELILSILNTHKSGPGGGGILFTHSRVDR